MLLFKHEIRKHVLEINIFWIWLHILETISLILCVKFSHGRSSQRLRLNGVVWTFHKLPSGCPWWAFLDPSVYSAAKLRTFRFRAAVGDAEGFGDDPPSVTAAAESRGPLSKCGLNTQDFVFVLDFSWWAFLTLYFLIAGWMFVPKKRKYKKPLCQYWFKAQLGWRGNQPR